MVELLVVSLFIILVVMGGFMVAFVRNVLHAIIGLGICLFGIAGLFLHLNSPFVAAMQVLIYIGGITVAMVFAMMLSTTAGAPLGAGIQKITGAIACATLFFNGVGMVLLKSEFSQRAQPEAEAWSVQQIGHGFM